MSQYSEIGAAPNNEDVNWVTIHPNEVEADKYKDREDLDPMDMSWVLQHIL